MNAVLEVLGTCRAVRWLKPDPVPWELVEQVVWAATRAPSPGNSQLWTFLAVDDSDQKSRIGDAIRETIGPTADGISTSDRSRRLMLQGAVNLMENLAAAPVVIFVCGPVSYPETSPDIFFTWSALFPAAQNLIIAARALGLGAAMTTIHRRAEPLVREVLGIPDSVQIAATIPVGWPAVDFGPVSRSPVSEVIRRNHWSG